MTVINLDDQIVASHYDPVTRTCSYTYQHSDGARYTVQVSIDELHKIGGTPANREVRRRHLATKIVNHVQTNKPDHV